MFTFLGGVLVVLLPILAKWLSDRSKTRKAEKEKQNISIVKSDLQKEDELREIRRRAQDEADRYKQRFESKYDDLEKTYQTIFLERFNLERDKYHLEEELKDRDRYIDELTEEVKARSREITVLEGQIIALTGERESLQTELRRLNNRLADLVSDK